MVNPWVIREESVDSRAEPRRPHIIVDGQVLYVVPTSQGNQGGLQADPASDFADGISTGPVDYDQRQHGFFSAVDNHSGGQGYERVSEREDIGLYHKSTYGVDSRRSKHLHAPPYILKVFSAPVGVLGTFDKARNPMPGLGVFHIGGYVVIPFPGAAFYSSNGRSWQRTAITDEDAAKLQNVFWGDNSGTATWYANFLDGYGDTDPDLITFRTAAPATFTAESKVGLWDVTFYQNYFWALGDNGIVLSSAYPSSSGGQGLPPGYGRFIGPGQTPTGYTGMYFLKNGRLFYAIKARDFYSSRYEQPLGDSSGAEQQAGSFQGTFVAVDDIETQNEVIIAPGFNITGAVWFGSSIILTNGYSCIEYIVSGSQEPVREMGFQLFRDATPEIKGGEIRAMEADSDGVYVAVQKSSSVYILQWNQKGWCLMGKIPEDIYVHSMGIGWYPSNSWPTTKRCLYINGVGSGGGGSSESLFPNGAGTYSEWTGDYTDVDESPANDSDYIEADVSTNYKHSFSHANLTVPSGYLIQKITVKWRMQAGSGWHSAYAKCRPFLRVNGSDYQGDKVKVKEDDVEAFEETWDLSPDTGVAWTESEANGMEFGFLEDDADRPVRITQAYIQIVYLSGDFVLYEMHLPTLSTVATPGVDRFAPIWDLYESWKDGGFIDLKGAVREFLASGEFTTSEYIEVYYSIDGDDSEEVLLGVVNEDGEDLHWGRLRAGKDFRTYRLRFIGYGGVADADHSDFGDGNSSQNMGNTSSLQKIAQSFQLESTSAIEDLLLVIKKVATPTDNLYVTIEGDSSGSPDGSPIATSIDYSASMFETDYGWRAFRFDGYPVLTGGATYWVVIQRDDAVDGTNYWRLLEDTGAGYANGSAKSYNGSSWSNLNSDLIFKVITDKRVTADMRGFVVTYKKRPPFRAQWQWPIDVNSMMADKLPIRGDTEPTIEKWIAFFEDLWNRREGIEYVVPGIRSGLIGLSAMPINVELDNESGNRVAISLQALEETHQLVPDSV